MIIAVKFEYECATAYMRCPAKVGRAIKRLQWDFFDWLYDRENPHQYWEIHDYDEAGNPVYGVSYGEDAFIYWLNQVRFTRGKRVATIITAPKQPAKKTIHF
ncbi:MAG: hypothetical protein ABS949_09285 [Solibacillus sp.]